MWFISRNASKSNSEDLKCQTFGYHCTAIPIPVGVRAEVTAGNTIIRVSCQWSCQGVVDFVRMDYQPEGGSLMMYTVGNTTATSATLPNLQCNTKYSIWFYARSGQINRTSSPSIVSLQTRGMYIIPILCIVYCIVGYTIHHLQPLPLPVMSLLRS